MLAIHELRNRASIHQIIVRTLVFTRNSFAGLSEVQLDILAFYDRGLLILRVYLLQFLTAFIHKLCDFADDGVQIIFQGKLVVAQLL